MHSTSTMTTIAITLPPSEACVCFSTDLKSDSLRRLTDALSVSDRPVFSVTVSRVISMLRTLGLGVSPLAVQTESYGKKQNLIVSRSDMEDHTLSIFRYSIRASSVASCLVSLVASRWQRRCDMPSRLWHKCLHPCPRGLVVPSACERR